MQPDREVKKWFKAEASKNPDKYYATGVLKQKGFKRKQCSCGIFYWTTVDAPSCGDPACSGGYRFIGDSPAKHKLDYIEVWKKFSDFFKKRGYTPIQRYPVAARWRDDTDFVQASIYDFQPYVVSGEVEPPASTLVVPQFCLRFKDIDNVGVTGGHYTGFVMIGQHAFLPREKWDQAKFFTDIHDWLTEGLGISDDEITFHEDAWAGGGNFGPCMEYFSRGLELGNQVYMMFEQSDSGNRELKLKVLDMGMGQERNAWFTQGTPTSFMTTFPTVIEKLLKKTGIRIDQELMRKFVPLSSGLNVDEVEDIDEAWKKISKATGIDEAALRKSVGETSALFSIAEHSRSLLVALSDGVLPSNVAGGYNLRVILRRALSFIEKYGWDISLGEVCEWHAQYLKPIFPELSLNLDDVKKILEVEKQKFLENRERSQKIAAKVAVSGITSKQLLEMYDSQGVSPEQIVEEAAKLGKRIEVPADFYGQVSEMHEHKARKPKEASPLNLEDVPETEALYFDDYKKIECTSKVLKIIGNKVILDKTVFYPTSGGQAFDIGEINGSKVTDVFKQGGVIIHVLEKVSFKEGDTVDCRVEFERRKQLTQHHTATHIINGACRKILGNHIWQAGAEKQVDKARLDITHYEQLSKEEIEKIEKLSNEIIKQNLKVISTFFPRDIAEKKYGFRLYQGGAVPGKKIRVLEIPGFDVEACGGTHLHSTGEAEVIKILRTSKIQDGVLRIEFAAGAAAKKEEHITKTIILDASATLCCEPEQLPGRAKELFEKWKCVVKKNKPVDTIELVSTERCVGNVCELTAEALGTQPEHIQKTIQRFKKELEESSRKANKQENSDKNPDNKKR